jgi:hypothetical protein
VSQTPTAPKSTEGELAGAVGTLLGHAVVELLKYRRRRALAALEANRRDYTAEGYTRQRAALLARPY